MKRRRRRRILAGLLALCLTAGALTGCGTYVPGQEDDETDVKTELTELEELPAATEELTDGYIGVAIPESKTIDASGMTDYDIVEGWLPVVVDEGENVYGQLDALAELLGVGVIYGEGGRSAAVDIYRTRVYLQLGYPIAGYENGQFAVKVMMDRPPVYHNDQWFVPLDQFLDMCSEDHGYVGQTEADTQYLLIMPPRETIQDKMTEFYKYRRTRYMFDFGKDLGYDAWNQAVMEKSAGFVDDVNGLLSLDSYTWEHFLRTRVMEAYWPITLIFAEYRDPDTGLPADPYEDAKYAVSFMNCMLQMDEKQETCWWDAAQTTINTFDAATDLLIEGEGKSLSEAASEITKAFSAAGKGAKLARRVPISEAAKDLAVSAKNSKVLNEAGNAVKYALSFAALEQTFAQADSWMAESCKEAVQEQKKLNDNIVNDALCGTVDKVIDNFSAQDKSGARRQWWADNYLNVLADQAALFAGGYFGVVTLTSTVWSITSQAVFGDSLEEPASYLNAVFGIGYEQDAMRVLENAYDRYFSGTDYFWTKEDERSFRHMLSNAIKACYVTRCFGINAAGDALEDHPALLSGQESCNGELLRLLTDVSNTEIPFGLMPGDLTDIGAMEELHYPNVVFPLVELTGQVLRWSDEKPAKGVAMEIYDEDGRLLVESETDDNGVFDMAFVYGDMTMVLGGAGMDVRKVNLHMNYRWYPVVMEVLEVKGMKKYQVDGLRVGEKEKERLVYLTGARTENGKTVLLVQDIDLGEGAFSLAVPDYQGGSSYTAYFSITGEIGRSEVESLIMRDNVALGSVYTSMMPEGGLLDGLSSLTDNMGGVFPDSFRNREMRTAEEINAFIEDYRRVNDMDPVYVLTTVNSEVKDAEPSMVNPE